MDGMANGPNFLGDWQAAEHAAVQHMKSIGFVDAQRTPAGPDGGLDAASGDAAAQVKFHATPVSRPEVQKLRGAAFEYRLPLFYSAGGYSSDAVTYADQAGVALFLMDPYGRCSPASARAASLVDPQRVGERKAKMVELTARRYSFAAAALREDAALFGEYARSGTMSPQDHALYTHVIVALDWVVREFHSAVNVRDFERADTLFEEGRKRIKFLHTITGSDFTKKYSDLEEAAYQGWMLDSSSSSEVLLLKVFLGVGDLRDYLSDKLSSYDQLSLAMFSSSSLIDEETMKALRMLGVVSDDPSILSPQLLHQVKRTIGLGVRQGIKRMRVAIRQLEGRGAHDRGGAAAVTIYAEHLANRILAQLTASDQP